MQVDFPFSPRLRSLRSKFQMRGFDLRVVGGSVRDYLAGLPAKDIDLCTDANPDEQIALYRDHGVRYHETGLAHGTLTVSLNHEVYEITSLRYETDHDGRRATCTFCRDWDHDLARRDLTINAMALTFEGELIDPFGGAEDMGNGVVRFVGDPVDRMREDYLRILRWLRFHGRFGRHGLDFSTSLAAQDLKEGLRGISAERIWMEMAKIVSGPRAGYLLHNMARMELLDVIGFDKLDWADASIQRFERVAIKTNDPITRVVALVGSLKNAQRLGAVWRWSNDEKRQAKFLAANLSHTNLRFLMAHDGWPRAWVLELAHLKGNETEAADLAAWTVPSFPVTGQDLMEVGYDTGPELGVMLRTLRQMWAFTSYEMPKEELLKLAAYEVSRNKEVDNMPA